MKNIHEILDDIDINNEDLQINEEMMSKNEKDRIIEMTLNKARLNNKKSISKRFILPLAAAMTLVLSFAVVFAQGGLSNIYYKLFGENIKYVNEMGTVIDESFSSNGITFNVANMLGDEHSFYIIFELIKENGESFKDSDYVEFDRLQLDFKSSGGYSWYQIEDNDENDNVATFILSGNTKKKIAGDKLKFHASDITEFSIKEPAKKFNPYEFLINNNEYISQSLTVNNKEAPTTDTNDIISVEEKIKIEEIYQLTPNYVLPWKYSNISAGENLREIYIDNIGFVENKLCIRFAVLNSDENSLGEIYFANKNNPDDIKYSEFVIHEEKDGVKYEYYIFNIGSLEELNNYDFIYKIVSKLNSTKGEWEVTFKADYKNTTKTIRINKETEINGKNYNVKNIKISPIALNIEMNNNLQDTLEDPTHNFAEAVSVVMKDNSKLEVSGSGSSTNALSSTINIMFKQPIDTTQIEKVIIGNLEIDI